jgi:hypothetical protein
MTQAFWNGFEKRAGGARVAIRAAKAVADKVAPSLMSRVGGALKSGYKSVAEATPGILKKTKEMAGGARDAVMKTPARALAAGTVGGAAGGYALGRRSGNNQTTVMYPGY